MDSPPPMGKYALEGFSGESLALDEQVPSGKAYTCMLVYVHYRTYNRRAFCLGLVYILDMRILTYQLKFADSLGFIPEAYAAGQLDL